MSKTYGVGPAQGYIANRDHMKSIRETGHYATRENPEYWLSLINSGQPREIPREQHEEELPLWLQLM